MSKYVEYIKVGTDEAWQVRDPDAHVCIDNLNTTVDGLSTTTTDQGTRLTNVESSITNLSSTKQNNLGFTPVKQGYSGNIITLGWNGEYMQCMVDTTDMGALIIQNRPWRGSSQVYGTSLPAAGNVGRIFFKKV